MTRDELITICERMRACDDALVWLRAQTYETAAECWAACERGDWMIWLLTEHPGVVPDRTLRHIAVDCARSVQPVADAWFAQHAPQHVGAGTRLLDLIESDLDAGQSGRGMIDARQVQRAAVVGSSWPGPLDARANDARAAANRAAWAAEQAGAAGLTGSSVRIAAWEAAEAAARSAASCDAASDAARAAAMDAARAAASAEQARIVRARVDWAEVERGLREVAR